MRFRGTIDKGSRVGDGCKGIRGIFGEQREGGNFDDDIDSDFFPSTHQRIPSPTTPDNSNTTGLHLFAPRTSVQFNIYQSQFGACKKGRSWRRHFVHRIASMHASLTCVLDHRQAMCVPGRPGQNFHGFLGLRCQRGIDRRSANSPGAGRCRHEEVCRDTSDRTPNAEGQMMTNPGLSE